MSCHEMKSRHFAVCPKVSSSGQTYELISARLLHSKTTLSSSDCFYLSKTNQS